MQERLTRLQAEMQEKDRQLQEAQSALEKTKSDLKTARASASAKPAAADTPVATPVATPQNLTKEQVEESYAAATKAMQRRVASELKSYSVENYTQFPVVMPSDEFPYHSRIALAIRSDSGRSYRLEFPVSADASGKWTFPTSVDVASALADSRQSEPGNATANNPTPTPTPAPTSTPRVAQVTPTPPQTPRMISQSDPQLAQPANETRVIDWGGGSTPGNKHPTTSPTPAAASGNGGSIVNPVQQPTPAREVQQPTPRPSASAAQPMQSDKDVTIHW